MTDNELLQMIYNDTQSVKQSVQSLSTDISFTGTKLQLRGFSMMAVVFTAIALWLFLGIDCFWESFPLSDFLRDVINPIFPLSSLWGFYIVCPYTQTICLWRILYFSRTHSLCGLTSPA